MKILFFDILTDDAKIQNEINTRVYGGKNYAASVKELLNFTENDEFIEINASQNPSPDLNGLNAVIIGGSIEDPIEGKEKPWMLESYRTIQKITENNIPLAGFCGGFQFTVRALGGEIITNPRGRNFGNSEVALTKAGQADPIFENLPDKITVVASHKCIAKCLKPEWTLLAYSLKSPFDAIAIGTNTRLFQFHPELSAAKICAISDWRKTALLDEKFFKDDSEAETFKTNLKDPEVVRSTILGNFLKNFVQKSI